MHGYTRYILIAVLVLLLLGIAFTVQRNGFFTPSDKSTEVILQDEKSDDYMFTVEKHKKNSEGVESIEGAPVPSESNTVTLEEFQRKYSLPEEFVEEVTNLPVTDQETP